VIKSSFVSIINYGDGICGNSGGGDDGGGDDGGGDDGGGGISGDDGGGDDGGGDSGDKSEQTHNLRQVGLLQKALLLLP
jgi:hypothetical protein